MNPRSAEAVHTWLIRRPLATGSIPARDRVASELGVNTEEIEEAYQHLAKGHGLVLHPHVPEPWVVHPFSLTPTLNWVETERRGWWAPCIWCALGVAVLAEENVRIKTRFGGEREPLTIIVRNGEVTSPEHLFAHFAIPPKHAWDNVHLHCALLLPFRSISEVKSWCERHAVPFGEAVPLEQAALLAREWYGNYAADGWHEWSKPEAQAIFRKAGLTSGFWDLGPDKDGF